MLVSPGRPAMTFYDTTQLSRDKLYSVRYSHLGLSSMPIKGYTSISGEILLSVCPPNGHERLGKQATQ